MQHAKIIVDQISAQTNLIINIHSKTNVFLPAQMGKLKAKTFVFQLIFATQLVDLVQ